MTCHMIIDLFTQTNTAPLECYMGIGPEVRKERFLKVSKISVHVQFLFCYNYS